LTDPHGIGLCPRCGFCRSLAVEGVAVLASAGQKPQWEPTIGGLRHALRVAPAALVVVCVAFVTIVPLAYFADQRLAPGSRERAVWSACNVLAGLLLVGAGQAWALTLLKEMKERVSWGDLASPLQLWGLTVRRLPATAWPVGLGGSGALTIVAAVVWVGGLSYWFSLYPSADDRAGRSGAAREHSREETEMARVARVLGLSQSQNEGATGHWSDGPGTGGRVIEGSSAEPRSRRPTTAVSGDSRPTERCVVVGFLPAAEGRPPGLIVATLRQGQLTFAGIVRKGLDKKPELLDRLSKISSSRPMLEGLRLNAVWVRPELFCEVHQSGTDAKGEMVDPHLKGLIDD
jgi:hypothetical protein